MYPPGSQAVYFLLRRHHKKREGISSRPLICSYPEAADLKINFQRKIPEGIPPRPLRPFPLCLCTSGLYHTFYLPQFLNLPVQVIGLPVKHQRRRCRLRSGTACGLSCFKNPFYSETGDSALAKTSLGKGIG